MADGIRRAAIMSDEKLKAIREAFAPGNAEMTASSAEAGQAREVVPVEYDGTPMEIGFNPQYLLDFLTPCGSDSVCMLHRVIRQRGAKSAVRGRFPITLVDWNSGQRIRFK